MGFFGNIGDTSKIHFQFDKIYNTRYEMDQAAAAGNDGVFSGRFVLVRYDINDLFFASSIKNAYYYEGHMYSDSEHTIPLYFTTFSLVNSPRESDWNSYFYKQGDYYYKLPSEEYFSSDERNYYIKDASQNNVTYAGEIIRAFDNTGNPSQNYYYCTTNNTNGTIANFIDVYSENNNQFLENNLYFQNYQIDRIHYGTDLDWHGYDATVWQKVYSEGNGKFILIARLSAIVPSIELIADAPSTTPSGAYIDNLSSDVKYRIHIPSNWGFRIKEAEEGEEEGEYPYSDQTIIKDNVTTFADIYMNLGGSEYISRQTDYHKEKPHKDTSTPNEILLTPTGKSGKIYYDATGQRIEEDILELGIHIPAVGNMIDEGFDLIYGSKDVVDGNITNVVRPRDINWYHGTSTAEERENGNVLIGGKNYDLTTFAGNINTMHKVLGQITYPLNSWPSPQEMSALSTDYLYIYNDNYYRRGVRTIPVQLDNTSFTYDQQSTIPVNEQGVDVFPANKYYIKVGNNYEWARTYDSSLVNNGYYLKNINGTRYTPLDLQPVSFEAMAYYIKEGDNYIHDNAGIYPSYQNRTYYKNIQTTVEHFTGQYTNDGSFYTYKEGVFTPSYSETPTISNDANNPNEVPIYYTIAPSKVSPQSAVYYYYPNVYYYKDYATNKFYLITDSMADFNIVNYPNFWILQFDTTPQYGLDPQGNIIQYYEMISSTEIPTIYKLPTNLETNPLTGVTEQKYLHLYTKTLDNEFVSFESIINFGVVNGYSPYTVPREFYELSIHSYGAGDLFLQGAYYYKTANDDYLKDSTKNLEDAEVWYTILSVEQETHPFYLPNTYYYQIAPGEYSREPDNSAGWTQGRIYCTKEQLYVDNDELGQCPHGFKWNDDAEYIPPSISLYTQEKKEDLILIPEIGEKTSSLYGLLLQLHALYGENDEEIRDSNTFRGAFNTVRDMLYQIRRLKPGHVLYVNEFGQIDSSEIKISDLT